MSKKIRQCQLLLPLLDVLDEHPAGLSAGDAVEAVAERISLPAELREERASLPGWGMVDLFARDVRWARQQGKAEGVIDGKVRNLWRLTPRGKDDLRNATPGVVITVFETAQGRAIWAEAESAFGFVADGSVNLWFTSLPYPLLRRKSYQVGDAGGADYLDWATALCSEMHRTLRPDGSIVLNLGDTFLPGLPHMSLYQERLLLRLVDDFGFRFCQRLVWHNPSKLPSPAQWVTIKRCRVTPATEQLLWLSKGDHPYADNRSVQREYSASMRQRLAAGGEKASVRPSGHQFATGAFGADNGGSISHNLISASHSSSTDAYLRYCKEHDLPKHPARMPRQVAEYPIKLLTRVGDTVGDCCAGSMQIPAVAEDLGRQWLAMERGLTYIRGGIGRFPAARCLVEEA
jgi:site-specific DNA-methyltransferase (cytosine-N4-specific)